MAHNEHVTGTPRSVVARCAESALVACNNPVLMLKEIRSGRRQYSYEDISDCVEHAKNTLVNLDIAFECEYNASMLKILRDMHIRIADKMRGDGTYAPEVWNKGIDDAWSAAGLNDHGADVRSFVDGYVTLLQVIGKVEEILAKCEAAVGCAE